jgi:hypothetical protein
LIAEFADATRIALPVLKKQYKIPTNHDFATNSFDCIVHRKTPLFDEDHKSNALFFPHCHLTCIQITCENGGELIKNSTIKFCTDHEMVDVYAFVLIF